MQIVNRCLCQCIAVKVGAEGPDANAAVSLRPPSLQTLEGDGSKISTESSMSDHVWSA